MGGLFRQNPMLGAASRIRFLPATHRLYNPSPLEIPDAADGLASGVPLPEGASGAGVLLTADGGRYPGELFGANTIGSGELVFTTGMMGYQESLTDPSFAGQVLTFTYPLIGNYGVHAGASESETYGQRALLCATPCTNPTIAIPSAPSMNSCDFTAFPVFTRLTRGPSPSGFVNWEPSLRVWPG